MIFRSHKVIDDILPFFNSTNSIFYTFVSEMVTPRFTDQIPTAAVGFSKETNGSKCIEFMFNEQFWESLNYNEKVFVFIHETLHVLFLHGKRGREYFETLAKNKRNHKLLNVAQDICINELILEQYMKDVPRKSMPIVNEGCLIDTVFGDHADKIEKGKAFPYYYEMYQKLFPSIEVPIVTFDAHDFNENSKLAEQIAKAISDLLDEVKEDAKSEGTSGNTGGEVNEQDNKDIFKKRSFSYGLGENSASDIQRSIIEKIRKKESLESLVKLAVKTSEQKGLPKKKYLWTEENRRTSTIFRGSNLMIPSSAEKIEKKHKILCYCDVSGSCESVSKKFLSLVGNLDEKKYEVIPFVFASNVKEAKKKGKTFKYPNAGYGTDINKVIRHFESSFLNKGIDGVFVLTDGYYTNIHTRTDDYFKKWHFFMIPGSNLNNCPTRSYKYELKNIR